MTDKDLKFTTAKDFVEPETDPKGQVIDEIDNNDIYRLEDGKSYSKDDIIKVERKEYHQVTHYLNREIPVSDIIEEFGSLMRFEKGLYQQWDNKDYDSELGDQVFEFLANYDYERFEDLWTDRKGGYDVDEDIVDEFTYNE